MALFSLGDDGSSAPALPTILTVLRHSRISAVTAGFCEFTVSGADVHPW